MGFWLYDMSVCHPPPSPRECVCLFSVCVSQHVLQRASHSDARPHSLLCLSECCFCIPPLVCAVCALLLYARQHWMSVEEGRVPFCVPVRVNLSSTSNCVHVNSHDCVWARVCGVCAVFSLLLCKRVHCMSACVCLCVRFRVWVTSRSLECGDGCWCVLLMLLYGVRCIPPAAATTTTTRSSTTARTRTCSCTFRIHRALPGHAIHTLLCHLVGDLLSCVVQSTTLETLFVSGVGLCNRTASLTWTKSGEIFRTRMASTRRIVERWGGTVPLLLLFTVFARV